MARSMRPLAIVTGGSSGIGLELARECLQNGFDVIIAADRDVSSAVRELERTSGVRAETGGAVEGVECDLADRGGVEKLWRSSIRSRGRFATSSWTRAFP